MSTIIKLCVHHGGTPILPYKIEGIYEIAFWIHTQAEYFFVQKETFCHFTVNGSSIFTGYETSKEQVQAGFIKVLALLRCETILNDPPKENP